MKIKIGKFIRNNGDMGPCDCLACKDELNGINFGFIYIGKIRLRISLCDKCLLKLRK